MTLTGVDDHRRRYLNLTDAQRIVLLEVAKYEAGPMPPFGGALLDAVREWTDLSEGKFWDYGVGPLVEAGLVEKHKDGHARRYSLTDDGRAVLAAGRDQLDDVLEELPDD